MGSRRQQQPGHMDGLGQQNAAEFKAAVKDVLLQGGARSHAFHETTEPTS